MHLIHVMLSCGSKRPLIRLYVISSVILTMNKYVRSKNMREISKSKARSK